MRHRFHTTRSHSRFHTPAITVCRARARAISLSAKSSGYFMSHTRVHSLDSTDIIVCMIAYIAYEQPNLLTLILFMTTLFYHTVFRLLLLLLLFISVLLLLFSTFSVFSLNVIIAVVVTAVALIVAVVVFLRVAFFFLLCPSVLFCFCTQFSLSLRTFESTRSVFRKSTARKLIISVESLI